jgi:MerR HTH family regulatory protein
LELYANARTSQNTKHANGSNDGDPGLRASHQALLQLIDTTDPAWPSIAAVLREMADAGVEIGEAAYEIAAKLGAHRHRHAMLNPQATRTGRPAYHQMTLAGTGDSIIYYIRRGDLIKIGTTTEPAVRFTALLPDEILAFEPGGQSGELLRHRQFDHLRCQGEYFRSAPELLEHICQLRHLHGDPDPSWPTTATRARTRGSCPVGYAALPPLVSHETVTVAEASRRFGIKEHRVWGWVRRGLIGPAGRDGRRRLFYVEHIAAVRERYDNRLVSAAGS